MLPILKTKRTLLRAFKHADASDVYAYAQSPNVGPNAGWNPHESIEKSQEIVTGFIRAEEVLAIVDKASNKVIGSIGITKNPKSSQPQREQRTIGYVLSEEYWGRGIMTEVVICVLDYLFNGIMVDDVCIAHFDFNLRSKRIIEKMGFEHIDTIEKKLPNLDDKKVISLEYKLTRESYLNRN